jgi:hypothetical protein
MWSKTSSRSHYREMDRHMGVVWRLGRAGINGIEIRRGRSGLNFKRAFLTKKQSWHTGSSVLKETAQTGLYVNPLHAVSEVTEMIPLLLKRKEQTTWKIFSICYIPWCVKLMSMGGTTITTLKIKQDSIWNFLVMT